MGVACRAQEDDVFGEVGAAFCYSMAMVLLKNLHEVAALIAPTLLQLQESLSVCLGNGIAAPAQQLLDQIVAQHAATLPAVSELQAQLRPNNLTKGMPSTVLALHAFDANARLGIVAHWDEHQCASFCRWPMGCERDAHVSQWLGEILGHLDGGPTFRASDALLVLLGQQCPVKRNHIAKWMLVLWVSQGNQ